MNSPIKLLLKIFFLLATLYLLYAKFMIFAFGGYNMEMAEYGIIAYVFHLVYVLSIIIIPILMIFNKNFIKCALAYIGVIIIYFAVSSAAENHIYSKYSTFSPELWIEKAPMRTLMVEDLKQNYNPVNKTKAQIIELLGEPDKTEENFFVYYSNPDAVLLYFEDDIVRNIDIHYLLD